MSKIKQKEKWFWKNNVLQGGGFNWKYFPIFILLKLYEIIQLYHYLL